MQGEAGIGIGIVFVPGDLLSAKDAESRLDISERILKPHILADVANSEALTQLQCGLLAGQESRYGRRRSPHTVKGYMGAVLAAMNWANLQGWIDSVPRIRPVKVSKLRRMKGRPITGEDSSCTATSPSSARC